MPLNRTYLYPRRAPVSYAFLGPACLPAFLKIIHQVDKLFKGKPSELIMHTTLVIPPFDIFTNQTLDIVGGAVPSLESEPIPVVMVSRLFVFAANSGTSTSCTVTIYGKPSATSLLSSVLEVFTLGAGTALVPNSAGKYIEGIPSYIYAVITNADATEGHTGIVTVTLDIQR